MLGMLVKLKSLLGITEGGQDTVLSFCLEFAARAALDYCNLGELPTALEWTVTAMAADKYRMEGYGSAEAPTGAVSSVSQGDESISYKEAAAQDASGLLKNYTTTLNRYRRIAW